jgi:hypothetical protein
MDLLYTHSRDGGIQPTNAFETFRNLAMRGRRVAVTDSTGISTLEDSCLREIPGVILYGDNGFQYSVPETSRHIYRHTIIPGNVDESLRKIARPNLGFWWINTGETFRAGFPSRGHAETAVQHALSTHAPEFSIIEIETPGQGYYIEASLYGSYDNTTELVSGGGISFEEYVRMAREDPSQLRQLPRTTGGKVREDAVESMLKQCSSHGIKIIISAGMRPLDKALFRCAVDKYGFIGIALCNRAEMNAWNVEGEVYCVEDSTEDFLGRTANVLATAFDGGS